MARSESAHAENTVEEHHAGSRPVTDRSIPAPATDELLLAQLTELAADEGGAIADARGRAGLAPGLPSPPVGALLAWTASITRARSVVEVGSASGVSGLWLLRGMPPRGVLTSIERDPRVQEAAARSFEGAGAGDRVRSILGEPLEVLGRLTDRGYDLLLLQSVGPSPEPLLVHVRRLLKPGGILVVRNVAAGSGAERRGRKQLVQALVDDERIHLAVLPLDGGVAMATLREDDA